MKELIRKLRAALKLLVDDQENLAKACVEGDTVRAMTPTERSSYDDLKKKIADVQLQLDDAVALDESQQNMARSKESTSAAPTISVGRQENENDEGEYRGFKNLGEQLSAVARSSIPGASPDARLIALHASVRAATGMSEGVGADGGFLVQTDFQQQLYQKTIEESYIASLCEQVTISSNSNELHWVEVVEDSRVDGSRNGGVRVYRDKEAGTVAASKVELRRDKLTLEKMTAIAYATEELLEDASGLQSLIEPAFVREMAYVLDEEIINGDGAGECLGINNPACKATVVVAKEGSQTAATINYENVRKMNNRIFAGSDEKAIWLVGSGVPDQLQQMVFTPAGGNSVPVYLPASGISERPYANLFGRVNRRNEHCSALGTQGDIILADFSQYRLARKGGVKGATSQHVRFIYGEMTFRWTQRVIGKPMWKLPLTPAKGSATESPFVVLATRS